VFVTSGRAPADKTCYLAGDSALLGQAQGGFAMGVGYALLETLPPHEGGPGNGQWNLGQYLVARGSDLPLHDLDAWFLQARNQHEVRIAISKHAMGVEAAGLRVAKALIGNRWAHEKIKMGVEHRLRVAGTTTAVVYGTSLRRPVSPISTQLPLTGAIAGS